MRAAAEPLEGNMIRLTVEVDETEVDRAIDGAVKTIAGQARVPGFRPGKVPRRVLEARMGGAKALRSEALREALPNFYAQAVSDTDAEPIAAPQISITSGEEEGPVAFEALVEIRPEVSIPGYAGLVVTIPSPRVTDDDIDEQIRILRENNAELNDVERPAADTDSVTIDVHATDESGAEVIAVDDYVYEVGRGTINAEFDEQLRGASVGDVLEFSAPIRGEETGDYEVVLKSVREKILPDATDQWASDNSEFQTIDALRDDLRERIKQLKLYEITATRREKVLEAVAELVDDDDVPPALVNEDVQNRLHELAHRLEEQGVTYDQFVEASGRTSDELMEQLKGEAKQRAKVDLALRAVAEAESLEVSSEEFDRGLQTMAERMNVDVDELRGRLERNGRITEVRSEQRKAIALDWLIDHVALVDEEGEPIDPEDLVFPVSTPVMTGEDEEPTDGEEAAQGPVAEADAGAEDSPSQGSEE
jgi:trigger factor